MPVLANPHRRDLGDAMPAVMLLTVVGASLVVLCLLAVVLWLSLTNGSPGDPDLTYTAQNFVEVFSDPRTFTVLVDTIDFSFVSLMVALAFGIPAAWLAERTDFPAKTLLFTLMAVGLLIPGFAAAMGWLFLLHPRIGLLNQFLMSSFHLAGPPLDITTVAGMGWVQGLNLAPLAFINSATEAQQGEYLPMVASGEARIAVGFAGFSGQTGLATAALDDARLTGTVLERVHNNGDPAG